MSKTKQEAVGRFELLHLIANKFTDEETREIAQKITKVVEDNSGKIIESTDWGKKRLAYPVKKYSYGYYNLIIFDIDRAKLEIINRLLNQMREILRFSIIKYIEPYEVKVGMPEKFNRNKEKPKSFVDATKTPTPAPAPASAPASTLTPDSTQQSPKKPIKTPSIPITTTKITTKEEKKESAKTEPTKEEVKGKKLAKTKPTQEKNEKDLDDKLDNILEAKDLF